MNQYGAAAGMITGGLTVIIWASIDTGIFMLYELVPGFILACAAIIIASTYTRAPAEDVTGLFDVMEQQLRYQAGKTQVK